MRLVSISPKPNNEESVDPLLTFDVIVEIQRGRHLPIDLSVVVRCEDKKILGVARPMASEKGGFSLDAREYSDSGTIPVSVRLSLPISPKHLDYLEDLRSRHRKGDVVLHCDLEFHFLVSKVVNACLKPSSESMKDETGNKIHPVYYSHHSTNDPFYSHTSNMWVLSGDGSRTFLERATLQHKETVTIGSSDWLHDYATPWMATKYMVVELPQPELLTSTPNIDQRVNAAVEAAKRSSENLKKGEWNDVIEDLRQVWELLRNDADIQGLLQRDGYPPEAIAALNQSIMQQFNLASKFLHSLDRTGTRIAPEIRASKEDAILCHSFAMSVLNLVARKTVRFQ